MGRTKAIPASVQAVAAAREQYQRAVASLDAQLRAAKLAAKQDVFARIRAAMEDGASLNSIATNGLGYSGIQGLANFVEARTASHAGIMDAINGVDSAAPVLTIGTTVQAGARAADRGRVGSVSWELRASKSPDHMNVWIDNDFGGASNIELDRVDGKWTLHSDWQLDGWGDALPSVIESLKQATGGNLVIENV